MMTRPLAEHERDVLRHMLSVRFDGVEQLRRQIDQAAATESDEPSIDLSVPESTGRALLADGVVPVDAIVVDTNGEYIGELLLWLKDGRLESLEYAWVTDNPPRHLPEVSSIRVSPRQ